MGVCVWMRVGVRVCMGCLWMNSGLCYIDLYVQKCEYQCSCESVLLSVTFNMGIFVCMCGACVYMGIGYECVKCLCGCRNVICTFHVCL